MDSFYNVLSPEQSKRAHENNFNFDHPTSFDYEALYETIYKLKHGKSVNIPIYDFSLHARSDKTTTIYGANVIIFEGIYGLYDKKIRDLMDLKPAFDDYIQPTVKHADVIIPRGLENVVAIDLITKHIQRELTERNLHFRWDLANIPIEDGIPPDVLVLPETNQIKGMHTILRDKKTARDEFVFYAERLSTIIVEAAFNLLPFENTTVTTPVNAEYHGMVFRQKLCGVSILRAGGTMETGLRRVHSDAVIGKLLIQTDPSTGEPQLHYCKLPADVKDHQVVLMDATIGTGAAGLMAIRVLLDHDVPEENIIFTVYLAAPVGLNVIAKAFPRVKIVTSMVDPVLSKETLYIEPGIGNFGGKYTHS
ncbi:uracil phosphoribosyltransferase-domain-containing protein [Circinella umbellata]|nr:uracil phosphoribosyltransferase-domain-containing protein [Circinella umbellata]